jgi:metal-responsive CopG/Arc/MetJ family transcriptional regulator
MSESQIIFRLEDRLLKRFDHNLKKIGFKSRNEWFRTKVREFLEEMERRETLRSMNKFAVKDMTEEDVIKMIEEWRKKNRGN